ncbi:MAG: HPF/RaiA family ribosome-associated protein [Gemmatimonadaceae bacterium]
MQVQVNTDKNIDGKEELIRGVEAEVVGTLGRFADQITRVEVHLSDVNAAKGGGDDMRCLMEARLAGRQPVAVSHEAATLEEAVNGAADKMKRSLDSTLGRLGEQKGLSSYGGDQTI